VELREAMLEERPLHKTSSKLDYGGPHSSRMKRSMLDLVMFSRELLSNQDETNCLLNKFEICKHLRSGQLILLE
jgi:hypothetical protein